MKYEKNCILCFVWRFEKMITRPAEVEKICGMDVPDYWVLKDYLPDWKLNDRVFVWLWLMLRENGGFWLGRSAGKRDMCRHMVDFIKNKRWLLGRLMEDKNDMLLAGAEFRWIDDNRRLSEWMLEIGLKMEGVEDVRLPAKFKLSDKEIIVARIDFCDFHISDKKEVLKRLQMDWSRHLDFDAEYDWFKEEREAERCGAAWEWYRGNGYIEYFDSPRCKNLEGLLLCLDKTKLNRDERRHHIGEIKRMLRNERVQRNRRGRRQTNIILSDDVRGMLDVLVEKDGATITEVMERMIRRAYEECEALNGKVV